MSIDEVADILRGLANERVPVWLDGGWCVDALVGQELRRHDDLDIAVERSSKAALQGWLARRGYSRVDDEGAPWNFTVSDPIGHRIDIHVFEHDELGNVVYGIEYPLDSLKGNATVRGVPVRCIAPEWMFRCKTAYTPRDKDRIDVLALSKHYGFAIPASHRRGDASPAT